MKKLMIIFLTTLLLLSITACAQTTNDAESASSPSGETMNGASIEVGTVLTDAELVDRAIYLFDIYVLPVHWWTGAGSMLLAVNEYVDPLDDTPENTSFYPVDRFNSIDEMRRATEQVVTKAYAESKLYPFLAENGQFLERDGSLYMNTSAGGGGAAFAPISATVISKSNDQALLSMVFRDSYGEEEVHEVELKLENGTWKLNSYPYL